MIEIVELAMVPNICEISRCTDIVDLKEVFVVFFIGFIRLPQEAKPNSPFVNEEMFLKH
jgi:hypothetical protein